MLPDAAMSAISSGVAATVKEQMPKAIHSGLDSLLCTFEGCYVDDSKLIRR